MNTGPASPTENTRRAAPGFGSLGLHPSLLRAVEDLGFDRPTEVQAQAIPPALMGRDVLACAMTGSGKTAAFLLPILQRLQAGPRRAGTRALILTPTRELAAQVGEHLRDLGKHTGLAGAVIHGGVAMGPQEQALRRGVDILVATPGRLLDHLGRGYARVTGVEVQVLDEADRMLDMGFLPDVRRVLARLGEGRRQTLLFSATLPPPIVALSRELMAAPVAVGIERKALPAAAVNQEIYPVPALLKPHLLLELLGRGEIENAIVFCRTRHRANRLAQKLVKGGVEAARIHGDRSQGQRTSALEGFKAGRYRVLVATDVMARGIDVEALGHVVNFDVPGTAEDYIHRIGRTGRAEATGAACTLVSEEEEQGMRDIERALGTKIERRRLPGFDYSSVGGRFEQPAKSLYRGRRALRAGT